MTVNWFQYALTGAGVNLATILGITSGGAAGGFTKIRMQLNPAATGPYFKIQGTNAAYSASTVGILRGIGPDHEYLIEDQSDGDGLRLESYFICGANAGDLLDLELHQS